MYVRYRKPVIGIKDRHVLVELDGDFTDDEMRHILNHAYLNHKAPHEYNEIKKYIRDIVIGKHNSVYIMNNGVPDPLASESIFYPNILGRGGIYYDYVIAVQAYCNSVVVSGYDNNSNCTSNTGGGIYGSGYIFSVSGYTFNINSASPSTSTYGYENGVALLWELLYSQNSFTSFQPTLQSAPPGTLVVGPSNPGLFRYSGIKYAYALYQTNNNPLTLTTYYYWSPPSENFSYVYFVLYEPTSLGMGQSPPGGGFSSCGGNGVFLYPIFYSQGNYSFNSGSYYVSMWQFTYT
jgi:hypothetical protein